MTSPNRDTSIPADEIWRVLSHPMRRDILRRIEEVETTTVESVSGHLTDTDTSRQTGGEHPSETTRVEVLLLHNHLPVMAETGVIDYDPQVQTVTTNSTTGAVYDLIDDLPKEVDERD